MIDAVYFRQAELLLRVLPLVDREAVFALKGGTAINFFVRDLPRVSVDDQRSDSEHRQINRQIILHYI